jgi:AhpD family alkylhydroperoxidase
MEAMATDAGMDKGLSEFKLQGLIKLRASQMNGCAFCVQYHLNGARKANVAQRKLNLAAAWRDAGIFSEREKAALSWTEVLTRVGVEGISDEEYADAERQFEEEELVFLTAAEGAINFWNRVAMAFRFSPPVP